MAVVLILAVAGCRLGAWGGDKKSKNRSGAIAGRLHLALQEQDAQAPSLEDGRQPMVTRRQPLGDMSTDYKAQKLNDTIVILVSVQTTAAQSGTSAISGRSKPAPGSPDWLEI
jgi:flagellar basal body L-ring protein FlgH